METQNKRLLSSRYTIMYRWVIPTFLSIAAIALIWNAADTDGQETTSVVLAVLEASGCVILARWLDRAKTLWIDDDYLYISNHRREARIPITNIKSVTSTIWLKPNRVLIRFKETTIFGEWIVFFPPNKELTKFKPHPIAEELKKISALP
ncbi:MAG: hypothetical protein VYA80_02245 [Pseudomonadota bacterium]|nr:hypothetical protein [Pseudomonadota bacterium]